MLPNFNSELPWIPLTKPATVIAPSDITTAFTPQKEIADVIQQIDPRRLSSKRSSSKVREENRVYSVEQLQEFAKRLGLPTGNKKRLVELIRAKLDLESYPN